MSLHRAARIHSIQVGRPRSHGSAEADNPVERPWVSAILKEAVEGRCWVGRTNIQGDRQADLKHHGGPDKAVLAYSALHYPTWKGELPWVDFPVGAFGENLTVDGLTEDDVAIGDVWTAGTVTFQVSQPRQPCWKLARRLRVPDMVVRVQDSLRSGWYLRVLDEGEIQAGDGLVLESRPHPEWSVAESSRVMYRQRTEFDAVLALADLPELSASWKRTLRLRAAGTDIDTTPRTHGP
ncbi:MAG: MOSC domain-containing protein [Longimicrobiales bacterium]